MGIRELKNELMEIIIDLYRKVPLAKEIHDENSSSNPEEVFRKYKKQVVDDPGYMAELLFTHVKCRIDFTNEYGDIDERFLVHISENDMLEKYKDKCIGFIDETDGIGWGFHDEIGNLVYGFLRT